MVKGSMINIINMVGNGGGWNGLFVISDGKKKERGWEWGYREI